MSTSPFPQPICEQIWNQKYRFSTNREGFKSDQNVVDTWGRIASACAALLPDSQDWEQKFFNALYDFKFLTAGRITAGAGTGRNVTLFNCYVMGTVPDSLDSIFDMLKEAAITMQQGGGIGYDFSTLRPKGAPVRGVESYSSGPLSFMDVWDAMCKTIMSAGSRRGAMMATMRCDHPDIEEFISAKQNPTRLRNFNVSVLISDMFMEAVATDKDWDLVFEGQWYKTIKAKDLWDAILQNTYDAAEPGVIFIDRINKENNLWFLETIAATNPCGEQPLPPYGACLLGSINLARMVFNPFTEQAQIEWDELEKTVRTAVRMLDSVVDISKFPLPQQEKEAKEKRRQGLGVTGLADLLFMIGMKYGSGEAVAMTERLMKNIAIWAYEESIMMAKEWGPAPCMESMDARYEFIRSGYMQRMPEHIHKDIITYGIRNTHLLSIAPTGTISMYAGNVSSGGEPIFAPFYLRKVTRDNGVIEEERVSVYSVNTYFNLGHTEKDDWWRQYMVTAQNLEPSHHVIMQAALQKWVDSSISKTVNLPEDITFEEFKEVYSHAYDSGCKGCTTYRPNAITGSILTVETKEEPEKKAEPKDMRVLTRTTIMEGSTYKLRWAGDAYYVTFNHAMMPEGWYAPFEIFINSKNPEHSAWIAALTRMISAVFQRGGDIWFVVDEMKNVHDPKGGQWVNGRYLPSLVALLGQTLEDHMNLIGYQSTPELDIEGDKPEDINLKEPQSLDQKIPDQCPNCKGFNTIKVSGCPVCQDCGHSKCG